MFLRGFVGIRADDFRNRQIEIAIAGVLIRLRGEFDARMLRAVLQAVRATS